MLIFFLNRSQSHCNHQHWQLTDHLPHTFWRTRCQVSRVAAIELSKSDSNEKAVEKLRKTAQRAELANSWTWIHALRLPVGVCVSLLPVYEQCRRLRLWIKWARNTNDLCKSITGTVNRVMKVLRDTLLLLKSSSLESKISSRFRRWWSERLGNSLISVRFRQSVWSFSGMEYYRKGSTALWRRLK